MATRTIAATGGNWSSTSTWVEGFVPTSSDDVVALAGGLSGQLTLDTTGNCQSINFTNYTAIFTWSGQTLNVGSASGGAVNLTGAAASMVNNGSTILNLVSTSNNSGSGWPITTAGTLFMPACTFNGVGGQWQLQDSFTLPATRTLTLTNGTLDTNGKACSWGLFALGTGTKTLTLGASTITMTGAGTSWSASTNGAGFTVNAGTSTIQSAITSTTFAGNGKTYYNLIFTGTGTNTISGANTFNNLTITPAAATNGGLTLQADTIINGTFTVTGSNSGSTAGRIVISPSITTSAGAQRTITANAVSLTQADFNFINAAGAAAPFTGTSIGDGSGNSNITFDSPRILYWVGSAANWSTLSKWSLSSGGTSASTAPLPQDSCNIDSSSGIGASQTFSTSLRYIGRNIDFTGVPNNPTFSFGGFNPAITGSLTWANGMAITSSSTSTLTFAFDTRSVTLTNNNITYPANFNIAVGGGTGAITLSDNLALNAANTLTFGGGTFNANNKNITIGVFSSSNSNTRVINMGSGTWTLSGTGTIWGTQTTTGLTINASTSTISITDTSASAKIFDPGNVPTFNNITITSGASATTTIQWGGTNSGHSGTINTLTIGTNSTLTLIISQTTNVTSLVSNGTSGNLAVLNSSSAGTKATINNSVSTVQNVSFISIKDSQATGGYGWFAGPGSSSVSGNSGWTFNASGIYISESTTTSENPVLAPLLLNLNTSQTSTTSENVQPNLTIGLSVDPSQSAYTVPGVKIV